MKIEIKVPEVGESITEGFLVEWHIEDGDVVAVDQDLFELETDKITMTVTAEAAGKVSIVVGAETDVKIGQIVGTIDGDVAKTAAPESAVEPEEQTEPKESESVFDKSLLNELSPAVRRLVAETGVNPAEITGTGKGGRLLKEDVQKFINKKQEKAEEVPKLKVEKQAPSVAYIPPEAARSVASTEKQTRKPMSSLRKRVAERLVAAQHNAAMLTTFNEVDMSRLMEIRSRYKDEFLKKHGVKLGIMSFFVKAVVDALKTVPEVNRMIDGNDLLENHYYDIGIAVSTDRGLMVPVIRDADKLSFAEVEKAIADYAVRAREGKIKLDELQGGVFTITNGGVFGSMMSTPILNPPQSAILGLHNIVKRPVVVGDDDCLDVRPMMYLAVSYDHRVIDGRESVTFLRRIIDCIENPERMMFQI